MPTTPRAIRPLVTRVRNAAGNSFEVQVQRVDGSTAPITGVTVHYTVVEEGVYNQAQHGVKMEAVKFTSTMTDSDSSWVGQQRSYSNTYTSPVVVGQVMTSNDSAFLGVLGARCIACRSAVKQSTVCRQACGRG